MMEGTLDVTSAKGSTVILAGRFKGEMRAVDVKLETGSTFNGKIFAHSTEVGGKINGDIETKSLKLTSSARFEGSILTDELAIDVGAEVSGSISKLQKN
jgi:cytoskeletal protein CcmA (bactofilin family)